MIPIIIIIIETDLYVNRFLLLQRQRCLTHCWKSCMESEIKLTMNQLNRLESVKTVKFNFKIYLSVN